MTGFCCFYALGSTNLLCCVTPTGVGSARSSEDDGQEDVLEGEGAGGYSAAYAKLANASMPERPVLAEIADPKQFAESRLASFISRMGSS